MNIIIENTKSIILQIGTNGTVDGYSDPVEVDTKGNWCWLLHVCVNTYTIFSVRLLPNNANHSHNI